MLDVGEFFGNVAFFTSITVMLPQIYKAYVTKSTAAISMIMLMNNIVCASSWIIYATYQHSMLLVYTNVIGLTANIILVVQKLYYD